jgi:uncharacterized protein GlcG (DUF336 family)
MDSRLVVQAGGLPIKIGGVLVGGIGVGGAPSGAIDETCARAGLDVIGAEYSKQDPPIDGAGHRI